VDHNKIKKEILDRCFELFSRKGFANVTIKEIAQELNISAGMLYHYFPVKREIFESLFAYKRETDIEELSHEIGEDADLEKVIQMFMKRWETNREFYQNLLMLSIDFFRGNGCTPDMDVFIQFSRFYSHTISSNFQIEEEMGQFVVIYLIGLYFHTLLAPGAVDMKRQLKLFRNLMGWRNKFVSTPE
jgi:AcrR family transcriptional regulator